MRILDYSMRSHSKGFSKSALSIAAVHAVIEDGIKRPIRLLLDAHCYPAALILTYSGMDTMAFLNMPANRSDVMRSDFIAWAERYVKITVPEPPSGADLYGTRCSVLHGGAPSRFTREGRGRPIQHVAETGGECTAIGIVELVRAFFAGVDQFLTDLAEDTAKAEAGNRRLEALAASGPYPKRS